MLQIGTWEYSKIILRVLASFWAPREHFWTNISDSVKSWNFQLLLKMCQISLFFLVFFEKNAFFFALFVLEVPQSLGWVNDRLWKLFWVSRLHFEHLSSFVTQIIKILGKLENSRITQKMLENDTILLIFGEIFGFSHFPTPTRGKRYVVAHKTKLRFFAVILSPSA